MSMTGISNSYNNYVTQNTNDTTKKNVAKSILVKCQKTVVQW